MEPTDLTIEILKGIRDETRKTNEEVQRTNEEVRRLGDEQRKTNERLDAGFARLSDRIDTLEKATVQGFVAVTARLEHIRDFAGERYRDHETRLQTVEKRLDAIEGPSRQ
jgi:hypothetical protein